MCPYLCIVPIVSSKESAIRRRATIRFRRVVLSAVTDNLARASSSNVAVAAMLLRRVEMNLVVLLVQQSADIFHSLEASIRCPV